MMSGMIYRNGKAGNRNFGPGGITMRQIEEKGQREGKVACHTGGCMTRQKVIILAGPDRSPLFLTRHAPASENTSPGFSRRAFHCGIEHTHIFIIFGGAGIHEPLDNIVEVGQFTFHCWSPILVPHMTSQSP